MSCLSLFAFGCCQQAVDQPGQGGTEIRARSDLCTQPPPQHYAPNPGSAGDLKGNATLLLCTG